jgi:four helix bundle protein
VYGTAKDYALSCRKLATTKVSDRGLCDQIMRACNSIVLNIAEGSADHSDVEFARFLSISVRSVYETVAAFDLAVTYGLIDEKINIEVEREAESLVKQLSSFRSKLLKRG